MVAFLATSEPESDENSGIMENMAGPNSPEKIAARKVKRYKIGSAKTCSMYNTGMRQNNSPLKVSA